MSSRNQSFSLCLAFNSARLLSGAALAVAGIIAVGFASFSPTKANAAEVEAASEANPNNNDIVINAGGFADIFASSSQIIDRESLLSSPANNLESVLATVAGLQQFRRSDSRSANPSAQGLTLRALGGNASSRSLVIVDGIPFADPFFGYIPFIAIIKEQLGAVNITKGGGQVSYGQGAVAGTLVMTSAGADQLPLYSLTAKGGSFKTIGGDAQFSPQWNGGYISVSVNYERSDGFYTTPTEQRVTATTRAGYEYWVAQARLEQQIGEELLLQWRGLHFEDQRVLRFVGADNQIKGSDSSLRILSTGPLATEVSGYYQSRDFSSVVISASTFRRTLDQYATPAKAWGGKVEIRPELGGEYKLKLGADYRNLSGETRENGYNANSGALTESRMIGGDSILSGLYGELRKDRSKFTFTASARLDHWRLNDGHFISSIAANNANYAARSDWEWSGRSSIEYRQSALLSWQVASYRGIRMPTLNELYRGFTVFPVVTRANNLLVPEKITGVELGVKATISPQLSLEATSFVNRLDDAIANVTIGNNLRQRQNIPSLLVRGIELSVAFKHGDFGLELDYSYNHSRIKASGLAFNNLPPAQTPAHAAIATASYKFSSNWKVAATARYLSKQNEDDLAVDVLPQITTIDALVEWKLNQNWTVQGRVENLTDKAILTRKVGTSTDLAAPRSFWLSVKFSANR